MTQNSWNKTIALFIVSDKLDFNEFEYKISEKLIKLRLKAYLAQDLWGYNEFYEIYNDSNEILMKAIEVLQKKEYEKINLDNGKN